MTKRSPLILALIVAAGVAFSAFGARADDTGRLISAMLAETPLVSDLRALTDEVGGRVTGSPANEKSVAWAVARFEAAGVTVRAEAFTMPRLWLEKASRARITGSLDFAPRVVAKAFSTATDGLSAPLLDGGFGTAEDYARLGDAADGAWILVETAVLNDAAGLGGLFQSYMDDAAAERRAAEAGAAGVVYMSSRPRNLLYRYPSSFGPANTSPVLVMEREGAQRALRGLRHGGVLVLNAHIDVTDGGEFESHNVIAEIPGSERPEEIVLIGAHLDSWGLGTGALDNGANVALVIDIARQIVALGLRPKRTIRFALWNGEEQGMLGSLAYTKAHAGELDNHVMTSSYDIGSGRITGFFTNGRGELLAAVERHLAPVAALGPFQHVNAPIVGTDNFDFMLEGVPNLVANQDSANYPSNYHARSDTFDKVDQHQLKLNAAIAAAITYGFANSDEVHGRDDRAAIEAIIETPVIREEMKAMGVLGAWENGERGRKR